MFGMGFFEILMVAVVAIIFLGPDKLPKALVDMAKFFRTIKKTMDDAKDALDKEVNLSKIKEEALAYKESFTQGAQNLTKDLNLKSLELDENLLEDTITQNSNENTQKQENPPLKESIAIKPKIENVTPLSFGENCKKESNTEQRSTNA